MTKRRTPGKNHPWKNNLRIERPEFAKAHWYRTPFRKEAEKLIAKSNTNYE
jgi:hypothetical protein